MDDKELLTIWKAVFVNRAQYSRRLKSSATSLSQLQTPQINTGLVFPAVQQYYNVEVYLSLKIHATHTVLNGSELFWCS
jgi:hypothetical protein